MDSSVLNQLEKITTYLSRIPYFCTFLLIKVIKKLTTANLKTVGKLISIRGHCFKLLELANIMKTFDIANLNKIAIKYLPITKNSLKIKS